MKETRIRNRPTFARAITSMIAILLIGGAKAAEIRGTVSSVSGKQATVTAEGDRLPGPGDKAEIFFKLPGTDENVAVATGKVTQVNGNLIRVNIEDATGDVETGQLVRIESARPVKVAAASPTPPKSKESTPTVPPPAPKTKTKGKTDTKPPGTMPTPTAAEKQRFAGRWLTLNENPSYTLVLSQKGNRVSGAYNLQNGSVSGEIRGDTIAGSWRQTGNQASGSFRLTLSADGQTLSGPWTYDAAAFANGFTGGGTWTLRRIR